MTAADDREVKTAPPLPRAVVTVASWIAAQMANAEADGYRRAVDRLRDKDRYWKWDYEQNPLRVSVITVSGMNTIADYLEAVEGDR